MTDNIVSGDGRFRLVVQNDGNVVLYREADGRALWASGTVQHGDEGPGIPDPLPPPDRPPTAVPDAPRGLGVSYYTAMTDPDCDAAEWAARTRDVGSQHTRVWALDAWANGRLESGTGMYVGLQPWALRGDLRFDLDGPSGAYYEAVDRFVRAFNATGQHVVITVLELYTWSRGKAGLVWVPDRNRQPVRNNINGVKWGDPNDDDGGYFMLPDETLRAFIAGLVSTVGENRGVSFEIGNEMPEKDLHYRMRDWLRAAGWAGRIQVNRNEDTPSQYDNMKIGRDFDALAIHGRRDLGYLDEDHGAEQHRHRTFRALYDSGDIGTHSFVLSSDGCRKTTHVDDAYDYPALTEVARDALARGYAFEHQACIKLRRFTGQPQRLDLSDLKYDAPMLRGLA